MSQSQTTEALFARYHAAWEPNDPDRIVALHSEDSSYALHDGSGRVHGRQALRAHFAELFQKLPPFKFRVHRTIFGERHWVLEWSMVVATPAGEQSVDMFDIVDVNDAGEVTRKDVYINGAQQRAFYETQMQAA